MKLAPLAAGGVLLLCLSTPMRAEQTTSKADCVTGHRQLEVLADIANEGSAILVLAEGALGEKGKIVANALLLSANTISLARNFIGDETITCANKNESSGGEGLVFIGRAQASPNATGGTSPDAQSLPKSGSISRLGHYNPVTHYYEFSLEDLDKLAEQIEIKNNLGNGSSLSPAATSEIRAMSICMQTLDCLQPIPLPTPAQ